MKRSTVATTRIGGETHRNIPVIGIALAALLSTASAFAQSAPAAAGSGAASDRSGQAGADAPTASATNASPGASPATAPAVTFTSSPGDPAHSHFKALDRNDDGAIDRSEAAAEQGLLAQFKRFDKNGDGRLSFDEYKAWRDWK